MMRAAAKDVHKIRGQSLKEVPGVQSFRWESVATHTNHWFWTDPKHCFKRRLLEEEIA